MIGRVADLGFQPVEGGVKIVFDVPQDDVAEIAAHIGGAGFAVRRYYPSADKEHGHGGSAEGYVRLGAERAMRAFTDEEEAKIVAAFEAIQLAHGMRCTLVGVDTWHAGS